MMNLTTENNIPNSLVLCCSTELSVGFELLKENGLLELLIRFWTKISVYKPHCMCS